MPYLTPNKHNKKLVFSTGVGCILSPDSPHNQGFYFIFLEKKKQKNNNIQMYVGTAVCTNTNTFNGRGHNGVHAGN